MIERRGFERLIKIIEELRRFSEEGGVIVVEGRKDMNALKSLGVGGEILLASSMPDYEIFRRCSGKRTLLLSDWDSKGKEIEMRLKRMIVHANTEIWLELSRITGKYIHSVEELPDLIRKACEFYRTQL